MGGNGLVGVGNGLVEIGRGWEWVKLAKNGL